LDQSRWPLAAALRSPLAASRLLACAMVAMATAPSSNVAVPWQQLRLAFVATQPCHGSNGGQPLPLVEMWQCHGSNGGRSL
jgi:hypothetical protein